MCLCVRDTEILARKSCICPFNSVQDGLAALTVYVSEVRSSMSEDVLISLDFRKSWRLHASYCLLDNPDNQ